MKTRIITAIGILAYIIPALWFGGWLLVSLIGCIIIFGGTELMNLSKQSKQWPMYIQPFAILTMFLLVFQPYQELSIPMLGVLALCFLSLPVFTESFQAIDSFLCISYQAFFFILAKSFMIIYDANPMYIWMIIIATYVCDSAAYFTGYFLGKHKLNPRISPKKTIEGSIGGWIFGALCLPIFVLTALNFGQ